MRTEDELMFRDLRCQKYNHPFTEEIWQTLHYAPDGIEILFRTTPKGALDDVRCWCGSLPKDPNA
jgi:hypothetical protein